MVGLDFSPPFNDFACFKSHGRRGRCRLLFGHWQAACTICGAHSISIPAPNHAPFILPIRFIHANKVQAAFEYAKSSLHLFIYLIFKQNLHRNSSHPFPRCWFAHGSRQTVRGRYRACFSTNRVWARCAHSILLHPPKHSIRRCAR